ncbi:MAG: beta-lactamase family protein [bacterium]|nr:beta-lactamase family protein [bacterium]
MRSGIKMLQPGLHAPLQNSSPLSFRSLPARFVLMINGGPRPWLRNIRTLSLVAILLSFGAAFGQTSDQQPIDLALMAERVQDLAASAEVPGGAVVVVENGRVVLLETFGVSNADSRPVDAETVFRVASVSKVFTAAAVARLVSEGRLTLEDDLRDDLSWLRTMAPGPEPVTLGQLLTHTSGFDDRFVGMFSPQAEDVRPLENYLAERMPHRTTEPGKWTRYSNHGVALAGLVVEKTTGMRFADAVDTLVLEPTGMDSSSFEQPFPQTLQERLARAYKCPPDECDPLPLDFRHTSPAGGLVTTPSDMGRFLAALVGGGGLDEAAREILLQRHWGYQEQISGMALAFQEQALGTYRGLVHAGNSSGYSSLVAVAPAAQSALFVVTTGGSTNFGAEMLESFTELVLANSQQPLAVGTPSPLTRSEAQDYVNTYLLARAPQGSYESFPARFLFSETLSSDNEGFLVRVEGGTPRRYGRLEGDLFASTDGVGRLAFERNASGRVVAMHAASVFFGIRFPGTFERLSWWESPGFINEVLSWTIGLPVLALIIWMLVFCGSAVFKRLHRSDDGTSPGVRRDPATIIGLLLAPVVTGFILAFGLGFLARFNAIAIRSPEQLAHGLPEQLERLLWLPWPIAIASTVLIALTMLSWKLRGGTVTDRLVLVVVALCSILFAAQLGYFHLLPL